MSGATVAKAQRHPAVELLARYRAVLGAAWGLRHELAGPQRLADERAFLPAALSLQDTPVHPAPRRAMLVIMAMAVVALGWSVLGQLDIVAVAPGRIVVTDHTKLIQPLEAGVVNTILVKDGDRVSAGQVLVELDATGATADVRSVAEQLKAVNSEALRSQALLVALAGLKSPQLGPTTDSQTRALLAAEWADISAKRAKLDAERARRDAELTTAREMLAKLHSTVPLAQQREADFKSLTDQGFISSHAGQDRTRERIELARPGHTAGQTDRSPGRTDRKPPQQRSAAGRNPAQLERPPCPGQPQTPATDPGRHQDRAQGAVDPAGRPCRRHGPATRDPQHRRCRHPGPAVDGHRPRRRRRDCRDQH